MHPLIPALSAAALLLVSPPRGDACTVPVSHVTSCRTHAAADDSLAARVRARIAAVPGARVAVAFHDLARGDTVFVNADTSFHAASTMKVPVMIELFRAAERHALAMDDSLLLVNRFASIVDGSPYELSAGDDSDSLVYARVGERVSVRWLTERMITRSSNLATNALIPLVGGEQVTATMRALGASRIMVRRGVEDGPAFRAGLNNTTTARDLATIMAAIEQGQAASPASCRAMRDILLRQEWNDRIPTGLPPGTRVAHKTGEITGTWHDAAIVYPDGRPPYVLVILVGNVPDEAVATAIHADIARMVHAHATASGHCARRAERDVHRARGAACTERPRPHLGPGGTHGTERRREGPTGPVRARRRFREGPPAAQWDAR